MTKRVITAVIAILILIPFLVFSETYAFVGLICFLSVIAAYELLLCTGFLKKILVSVLTFALSLIIPISTRLWGFNDQRFMAFVFVVYFLYITMILTVSVFSKGTVRLQDAAVLAVLMLYVTFGFSSLIRLRDMQYGGPLYIMAIAMPCISDTFAYIIGCNFGRHKLIEDVSPKKTVEGAVGAIVCTSLFAVGYGFVCGKIFSLTPEYLFFAVVGIVLSIVAQCGDLVMSHVKRVYGIKDFGIILPGHGGILDRCDSIIAISSLLYFLCTFLPVIAFD